MPGTARDDDGNEITFVGSTDGWVYQFDKGTSFDGANISAYITLNYDPAKSPRILKSYRRAVVEVFGTSYAELQASYKPRLFQERVWSGVMERLFRDDDVGRVGWRRSLGQRRDLGCAEHCSARA